VILDASAIVAIVLEEHRSGRADARPQFSGRYAATGSMGDGAEEVLEMKTEIKLAIRTALSCLVESQAAEHSLSSQEVANEVFYSVQRHPSWGRNASGAQKRAAYTHWKRRCHRCGEELPFADAIFHHLKRGIPDQHAPSNLVPQHVKCHDREHGLYRGSLAKGAPRKGQ